MRNKMNSEKIGTENFIKFSKMFIKYVECMQLTLFEIGNA